MANRRSKNWLSQQRVDAPHLREVESAVRSDFDELLSSWVIGQNKTFVVRGFDLNMAGALGGAASGLSVNVADGAVLHGTSTTSGTFYVVPVGTAVEVLNSVSNSKVQGSFTPNSTNYVALDFVRAADPTTSAPVAFRDVVTKTEFTKNVPLAQILNYKFVINTSGFAASSDPLYVVQTDASNNVISITDRRELIFRLGKAGFSAPNVTYTYPWNNDPAGRTENPSSSTSPAINPFQGGDKQIKTLKEWMDALMSAIKEIKGTPYWYSANAGGSVVNLRSDLANLQATGRGRLSHSDTFAGQLNWTQDIFLKLITSRLQYKIEANPSSNFLTLADGQVAWINLVRGQAVLPNLIFTNSSAIVSSVGSVPWTTGLVAGDFIRIAGTDDTNYYEILTVDSASQVTLKTVFTGMSTGVSGIQSEYAWGVYQTVAAPSTNRHIQIDARENVPSGENMFWLFYRDDNGGSLPRVYTRFKAGELEQGESQDISDGVPQELLDYVGSTGDFDSDPDYGSQAVASGSLAGQNYNTVQGENLTVRAAKLTAMLADMRQDINTLFDAQIAWNGTTLTVSFAKLSVPGTGVGLVPCPITTYSGAILDDECLYVDVDRTTNTTLTFVRATLVSLTPANQRRVLIRRLNGDIYMGAS